MLTMSTLEKLQKKTHVTLSADNFRPYITSFQGNNCTDYINAVFVDVSRRETLGSKLRCVAH